VETRPQQTWSAVSDAKRGLALVSSGLLECSGRALPERPLALTLFRATRRTVMTDGEPGGQLRGELSFRYWVLPLRGAPNRARLFEAGIQLGAGLRDLPLAASDLSSYRGRPAPPPRASLLAISGGVVATSVREVEGAMEVRLF